MLNRCRNCGVQIIPDTQPIPPRSPECDDPARWAGPTRLHAYKVEGEHTYCSSECWEDRTTDRNFADRAERAMQNHGSPKGGAMGYEALLKSGDRRCGVVVTLGGESRTVRGWSEHWEMDTNKLRHRITTKGLDAAMQQTWAEKGYPLASQAS